MNHQHPIRLLIIGGGPAGTQAAMTAASLGAEVTLVEKDIVGGAAHLLGLHPFQDDGFFSRSNSGDARR